MYSRILPWPPLRPSSTLLPPRSLSSLPLDRRPSPRVAPSSGHHPLLVAAPLYQPRPETSIRAGSSGGDFSAMAPHYQATTLIASPSYPNAITWSSENLVAVASGHIVTILNPAALDGPRGIVSLRPSDPFPIGVVNREDLFEPCLLPTCLARDTESCAQSISWSQQGFAPNSGYNLLTAVCTVDGHVHIYRPPICEFSDEWVKVADISQLLFNYYQNINFGESDAPDLFPQEANNEYAQDIGYTGELQESLSCRGPGRRKRKPTRVEGYVYDDDRDALEASRDADFSLNPCSNVKKKYLKKTVKPGHEMAAAIGQSGSQNTKGALSSTGENKLLITAKQYACRNALLSSLVVAWSPALLSRDAASYWCILAVGSKSGDVSFWKIHKPKYYTIDVCIVPRDSILIGVLRSHNSWVSAMSLVVSSASSSKSSLLLATGCLNGSVKIWAGDIAVLNQCTDVKGVPFSLVAEVTTNSSAPVSAISLFVPAQPKHEVPLAIGRVSGSLETWIWDVHSNKVENNSTCHAHDQVVTGLSWSLDGHCLYSCSQDNSASCWIFEKKHLQEIPVHTNFPELKESINLPEVSDRCFGLSLAPGELMIAVVRSLDPNMLDHMYQASRTQKAVVEFIWIGGHFRGIPLEKNIHIPSQQSALSSAANFLWWGSNIFWSLKKYEKGETELVLWDVIAALQVFKKSAPTFLETLMHKWVLDLFSGNQQCVSIDILYQSRNDMMSNVSSRKLHLLNIICRKVMLNNHAQCSPDVENGNNTSTDLWNSLLVSSERELRERLVAFTFAAVLNRVSYFLEGACIENRWFPVGIAQMDRWLSINDGEVCNQLKSLGSKIKDLRSSVDSVCDYSVEETCTYCSAPVHFKSPGVALCVGDPDIAPVERHTLPRCKATMRLCSVLEPIWFCVCCGEMVDRLVPETFFTMAASPLDANHDDESLYSAPTVPHCPFCSILLQRSTPEFLLSVSPV